MLEVPDGRAGEVALGALGEHGRLGDQVRAGLEVRELVALAVAALVAGADADHRAVLDEQLGSGGLAEDVHAGLLGLLDSQRPSWAIEVTWLPSLRNGGGVGFSGIASLRLGSM